MASELLDPSQSFPAKPSEMLAKDQVVILWSSAPSPVITQERPTGVYLGINLEPRRQALRRQLFRRR